MLLPVLIVSVLAVAPVPVNAVPSTLRARLSLSDRYAKTVDANGFPILASKDVADAALREARFVVSSMLSNHPEYLKDLGEQGIRLVVMAPTELTTDVPEHADLTPKDYWDRRARGLGATRSRPAMSCAEENLIEEPGDPYGTESICVHEFAHTVADFAIARRVPSFTARLRAAFENAKAKGIWKGTYAATNEAEYWAEAVQSWFDTNRHDDSEHGTIDTREEVEQADPLMAALIREAFGEVKWRYAPPSRRSAEDRATLGAWPSPVPTFRWPTRSPPTTTSATGAEVSLQPMATLPSASPKVGVATRLTVKNAGTDPVELLWLTFEGARTRYATIAPGASVEQATYAGHVWILTRQGQPVSWFAAPEGAASVVAH